LSAIMKGFTTELLNIAKNTYSQWM